MATQSVRIGWRPYVNLTSVQTSTYLLDSYSGSAAAYSLRKLKSSYTGSAIRVRRSSDNAELNIGFDSDGNLDTYSLSAFVGSGNGFVTTWYDQSGSYNLIQTSAANQPSIILSGIINTQNNKPVLITDGSSFMVNNSVSWSSTTNSIFATIKLTSTRGYVAILSSVGTSNQHFVSRNVNGTGRYYDSGGQEITAAALPNGFNLIGIHENTSGVTVFENGSNLVTNFAHDTGGTLTGIVVFRRDNDAGNVMRSDSGFSELVIYGTSKLSDNSAISNNINTYYSVYPNPTSVWNLLTAAYNADTKSLPSLKTSLFAVYNGESNTNDSKGTNNGTPQGGLTYGTGKIGNAFSFNGSNAYVSLTNSSNLTGNFSISVWINPSVQGSYNTIFEDAYLSTGTNRYGIALYIQGSRVRFATYNVTGNLAYGNTSTISNNTWQHIVITKTTGNAWKMYINNTLQSLITVVGDITTNPGVNVNSQANIGSDLDIGVRAGYFNGSIDALNIWSKELTASEVIELYNSGNGAQYITDSFYKPTTNDVLGTNNGTAQGGLTYGLGKVGTAFQFNGSNSYVSLPNNSFKFTGNFSVSLWFYCKTSSNAQTLINGYDYTGSLSGGWILVVFGTGNFLDFQTYINTQATSKSRYQVGFNTSAYNNQWVHITLTRVSSTSTKIYINGTEASGSFIKGSVTDNPTYLTNCYSEIGGDFVTSGGLINPCDNGTKIDAVNVWQKELTASEVTELYNSGNGKQYPN